jgi:hypothetical protein
MASINSPTDETSLHPEILSIGSLAAAHAQNVYFSGRLAHKVESVTSDSYPREDKSFHDVWAQLSGTTLSIEKLNTFGRRDEKVPPTYVDVTDAVRPPSHLQYLRDSTKPSSLDRPHPQMR